jgi:hypothetical protein
MRSVKKQTMNNIKRFSDHREKEEIRGNAETQFWNGLIFKFVHGVAIKGVQLISDGI